MFAVAPTIVLASGSSYRRQLLERLGLPFQVDVPGIDETPGAGETAPETALRLAASKAQAVGMRHPGALVIGSDQVAVLDGEPLGKPGDHPRACAQLQRMSGREVDFHTAVYVLNTSTGTAGTRLVTAVVSFRELDEGTIASYLEREKPYDCAGSARVEALGITLVNAVHCPDPTALIGLPLIALTDLLRGQGVRLP